MRSIKGINKYVATSSRLQSEHILLDRLSSDFNSWKGYYKDDKHPFNMKFSSTLTRDDENIYLFDHLIRIIDDRFDLCIRQLRHVRESFSDQLALANMTISYRLQWIGTAFTVVSVVIAIVGLIAIWPNIQQFAQNIGIPLPVILPTSAPTITSPTSVPTITP
jgi:hypothetical protein